MPSAALQGDSCEQIKADAAKVPDMLMSIRICFLKDSAVLLSTSMVESTSESFKVGKQ